MKFLQDILFCWYGPEIVKPQEVAAEKAKLEKADVFDKTVEDIKKLDEQYDEFNTEAMKKLLDIEDKFNKQVASLPEAKRKLLEKRIDFVKDLITKLGDRDRNFNLDNENYRWNQFEEEERLAKEQKMIQGVLDKFDISGGKLKLAQAPISPKSGTAYGVELDGKNIGMIVFNEDFRKLDEFALDLQIRDILENNKINFKEKGTVLSGLPFDLNIESDLMDHPAFGRIDFEIKDKKLIVRGFEYEGSERGVQFDDKTASINVIADDLNEMPIKWRIKETMKNGDVFSWNFNGRELLGKTSA